jgi:hypothetical protein
MPSGTKNQIEKLTSNTIQPVFFVRGDAVSVFSICYFPLLIGAQSLKSSRMRLICERLTGISVCFLSFIFSMKVELNHGTTSLM